jgi:hypothetical protein
MRTFILAVVAAATLATATVSASAAPSCHYTLDATGRLVWVCR